MCTEMFRDKPVLHCIGQVDQFYADLFCMLSDVIGSNCIIETDDICRHHFYALVSRLCDICYCHEISDDIDEVLIVSLGNARA